MKIANFFGSSTSPSSKKEAPSSKSKKGKTARTKSAKSCSFGSTVSSSSAASDESVATPRTVLPPSTSSPSGSGTKRPAAMVAVTRRELEVALRSVVSTEEELAAMLADAEATCLALEGIAAVAAVEAADEGELRTIFAVFDADGDGRISAEELRAVLSSLGDDRCSVEDCRRMIGGVDTDGDGFVCFDEFTRMMMHVP